MKLSAVFTQGEKYIVARCPELGVTPQGKTMQEAKKNLKEAIELHLESLVEYMMKNGEVSIERGKIISTA